MAVRGVGLLDEHELVVGRGVLAVVDVPAEGDEERINQRLAGLRFLKVGREVGCAVGVELFDQLCDFVERLLIGDGHSELAGGEMR